MKVPTWFTNEARTLVRGLLTKEANQRLGVDPDSPTHASDMTSLKVRGFDGVHLCSKGYRLLSETLRKAITPHMVAVEWQTWKGMLSKPPK